MSLNLLIFPPADGRGRGRGARGSGPQRGGRRPFDRHSQTGKTSVPLNQFLILFPHSSIHLVIRTRNSISLGVAMTVMPNSRLSKQLQTTLLPKALVQMTGALTLLLPKPGVVRLLPPPPMPGVLQKLPLVPTPGVLQLQTPPLLRKLTSLKAAPAGRESPRRKIIL